MRRWKTISANECPYRPEGCALRQMDRNLFSLSLLSFLSLSGNQIRRSVLSFSLPLQSSRAEQSVAAPLVSSLRQSGRAARSVDRASRVLKRKQCESGTLLRPRPPTDSPIEIKLLTGVRKDRSEDGSELGLSIG